MDGWMEFLDNYHQPPEGKNHVGLLMLQCCYQQASAEMSFIKV